ncbi:hypothetical protein AB5J62_11270 [Amycolatopsis sp. cg5]|uniref:hypothetical protein n=1 Tax=Amycolatopsis sp. cg5 TaxID=3238802 RepID=UPI003524DBEA
MRSLWVAAVLAARLAADPGVERVQQDTLVSMATTQNNAPCTAGMSPTPSKIIDGVTMTSVFEKLGAAAKVAGAWRSATVDDFMITV